MHHFRHSFATLVTAKLLLKTTQFTRELLHHHPKTLEWLDEREKFRKDLFGNSTVRSMDLQAVAHLLGHGSAEVSVESYIHSLDWFEEWNKDGRHNRKRTAAIRGRRSEVDVQPESTGYGRTASSDQM